MHVVTALRRAAPYPCERIGLEPVLEPAETSCVDGGRSANMVPSLTSQQVRKLRKYSGVLVRI